MKRFVVLALLILSTLTMAAKKPKVYATFPPHCKPKAKIVRMECAPISETKWHCEGGYVEIQAYCIAYVDENGDPLK